MLMCGVAFSLSAPQLCCCKLRCCGSPGHSGHCPRGANSAHISHPAACCRHISAGEQLQLGREQRAEITCVEVGHEAVHRSQWWCCGVVTSCHDTFQPFLLRTDGDNNSHDLAIFQPSPKCGTKLPTILRVQLQNCQVRWGQLWTWWLLLPPASWGNTILFQVNQEPPSHHLAARECKY